MQRSWRWRRRGRAAEWAVAAEGPGERRSRRVPGCRLPRGSGRPRSRAAACREGRLPAAAREAQRQEQRFRSAPRRVRRSRGPSRDTGAAVLTGAHTGPGLAARAGVQEPPCTWLVQLHARCSCIASRWDILCCSMTCFPLLAAGRVVLADRLKAQPPGRDGGSKWPPRRGVVGTVMPIEGRRL